MEMVIAVAVAMEIAVAVAAVFCSRYLIGVRDV